MRPWGWPKQSLGYFVIHPSTRQNGHDVYRLLKAVDPVDIARDFADILGDDAAGPVTRRALAWLADLSTTPDALVPRMAGRREALVGEPGDIAEATWGLVRDLFAALRDAGLELDGDDPITTQ